MDALNGWTSQRLDDLAREVAEVRATLGRMQDDELQDLRERVRQADARPRAILIAFGAPLLAAVVSAVTVVLTHA